MSEVNIIFPPYSAEFLFPEIGAPRLAAHLNFKGIKACAADLNALFPEFLLGREETRKTIEEAAGRLPAAKRGNAERLLSCLTNREKYRERIAKSFYFRNSILGLLEKEMKFARSVLTFESAREALDEGDETLESFYRESFLSGAGVRGSIAGFSILSPAQVIPALILAKMLKKEDKGIKVVWGGPWCSEGDEIMPAFLKAFSEVDFIIAQGGEQPLLALINALKSGGDCSGVPNLTYMKDGMPARTRTQAGERLNNIPAPEFHTLPLEKYPLKILTIQTVNQCYWGKCVMCHHYVKKPDMDVCDPSVAVDRMEECRRLTGINNFIFADCATPVDVLDGISGELIRRKADMRWAIMARAEKEFTRDFCQRLRKAGCRGMRVGLETASKRGLKYIKKGVTLENVDALIDACHSAGIALQLFVMDYPGCSAEEVLETFRYLEKRKTLITDFSFQNFQLSRSSAMFKNPSKYGIELSEDIDTRLDFYNLPYKEAVKQDCGPVNVALKALQDNWPRRGNPLATSWERSLGLD